MNDEERAKSNDELEEFDELELIETEEVPGVRSWADQKPLEVPVETPVRTPVRRRPRRYRRSLKVGSALGRTFSIWLKNFVPFLVLTVIVFVPYVVYTFLVRDASASYLASPTHGLITEWGPSLLAILLTATVIHGVFDALRSRKVSWVGSLGYGLGRLLPVLGTTFLVGLCFGVWFIPGVALVAGGVDSLGFALSLIGLVIGIVVYCGLFVAVPACVVERPGFVASLRRSWHLTKRNRGSIFLLLFLFWILEWLLAIIIRAGSMPLISKVGDPEVLSWVNAGVSLITATPAAILVAIVYHDLRVAVDGVDTEQLAEIFD